MDFGEEFADLDPDEQRRMAEELGISLENLDLVPKNADKSLLTPAANHVSFKPAITIEGVSPNAAAAGRPTSNALIASSPAMGAMFDANLLAIGGQRSEMGATPRRQTFQ